MYHGSELNISIIYLECKIFNLTELIVKSTVQKRK